MINFNVIFILISSDLILIEDHVWNTIDNWVLSLTVHTYELALHDVCLQINKITYVKNNSMQLSQVFFILHVLSRDIFGKINLTQFGNCFMKSQPIKFLYQSDNIIFIELTFFIN